MQDGTFIGTETLPPGSRAIEPRLQVPGDTTLKPELKKPGFPFQLDLRIRKYEIVFIAFAVVSTVLVSQTHLPLSTILVENFLLRLFRFVMVTYGLALTIIVGRGFYQWAVTGKNPFKTQKTFLPLVVPYGTLNYLQLTLRRGISILGVLYFFLHLKHVVLLVRPANFDLFFWDLDRRLHFGIQPNAWLMEHFGTSDNFSVAIDYIYSVTYFDYLIFVAIAFLLELRGRELTEKFFLAYTLLWSLGGLGYFVMPADGPCYAILGQYATESLNYKHITRFPVTRDISANYAETYKMSKTYKAQGKQEELWLHRQRLFNGELPNLFYGIAAMPSLHVAATTMVMIFLFYLSQVAGVVALIWMIPMCIGSVFLQWHYAVDGYAGLLLASLVCFFSLKFGGSWRRELTRPCGRTKTV